MGLKQNLFQQLLDDGELGRKGKIKYDSEVSCLRD